MRKFREMPRGLRLFGRNMQRWEMYEPLLNFIAGARSGCAVATQRMAHAHSKHPRMVSVIDSDARVCSQVVDMAINRYQQKTAST